MAMTGLRHLSRYEVRGEGFHAVVIAPPAGADPADPGTWPDGVACLAPDNIWIKIVGPIDLVLGTFKTDADGLGGIHGAKALEPGIYEVSVKVYDTEGTQVLGPALEEGIEDTTGFIVY